MINLQISEEFEALVSQETLEKAALAALAHQQHPSGAELSVVVDNDARLQELNNTFLGIDAPTDVLSFPAGEGEIDPETGQPYLGDIIISYPRALEQSAAAGHAVMDEIQLLVVHGVLHLLGYDHAEDNEKAEMWAAQREILQSLNVRLNRLPE